MEWMLIDTAPLDRDLELAIVDSKGTRHVAFPCRRLSDGGWVDVETNTQIYFNCNTPRTGVGRLTNAHDRPGGIFRQVNVSNS
jgi:hypothetical protein